MSGVYSMTGGPSYTGASRQDLFDSAMNQPLSLTSTLLDQAKGGILESFGLGTAIKDITTPQGNEAPSLAEPAFGMAAIPIPGAYTLFKTGVQALTDQGQPLTEDAYKGSASYRKDIPWDAGMTDTRAAALAASDDAKKVREYYATKRPFASFIGAMAGQALDPVNYVPVFGEAVQAAAIGRFGYIGGRAMVAGADAALNTGIAGAVTSGARGSFGDDVSWQGLISQMATAAMIGGAFGTLHGVFGSRVDQHAMSEAESRLATLRTTQESLIGLNEGIDAMAHGEDIKLSPNVTEPMARVADELTAYHGSPHDFSAFATEHIGKGEGAQAYGRGLYFAENADIAKSYQLKLGMDAALADNPAAGNIVRDLLNANGGDFQKALTQLAREFESSTPGVDNMRNPVYADAHNFLSQKQPGNLYEVKVRASKDHMLDWDKPLSEQSPFVQDALRKQMGDANFAQFANKTGGEYVEYGLGNGHVGALMDAGIPGIKYLDAASRNAGDGSHNIVVFDQNLVKIARKNGAPIAVDTTPARPDVPPEGIKQAEASIAKPEDAKNLAEQYRVDPKTGTFPEEADLHQLSAEGRFTEQDAATMAQAQADYETGASFAEALKSVAGCLL